jgi:hypothetical protein
MGFIEALVLLGARHFPWPGTRETRSPPWWGWVPAGGRQVQSARELVQPITCPRVESGFDKKQNNKVSGKPKLYHTENSDLHKAGDRQLLLWVNFLERIRKLGQAPWLVSIIPALRRLKV